MRLRPLAADSSIRSATRRTDVRVDFVTDSKNHGSRAVGNGFGTYLPGLDDEDAPSTTNGDEIEEAGVDADPFVEEGPVEVEGDEVEDDAVGRGGGSISEIRRGTDEAGWWCEMGVPRLVMG